MRPYFTRERFGKPQFLAGLLLLAFLGQAIWLVHAELRSAEGPQGLEAVRITEGWKQWHGRGAAGSPFLRSPGDPQADPFSADASGFEREHSPLVYLVSAAPLMLWPREFDRESSAYWQWLPRVPFLACGVFLGASLWYVARRLCGNAGGFIALTFYCFSPSFIQASALWHTEPEILSAWGSFGAIFTAIAVAHTLYAPREVVLWNWRRIVLLGVSLTIAVGSQFSMIVLIPIALAFLVYVAPIRRKAGILIWAAACSVAALLLFAAYFFHAGAFVQGMRHAEFWGATWRGFAFLGVYKQVAVQIGRACPALPLVLPATLVAYALWPRTRYFGNSAPLLMAVLFLGLGMAHPHLAGAGFLLAATPFLLLFVSGVLADLMETRYRNLLGAAVFGMLLAYVAWSLLNLLQVTT
jgi:hypothetical protein